ncbi:MAG: transketolase family protein [Candidatus Hodarchaeales archaeon]|jgi:transketolase
MISTKSAYGKFLVEIAATNPDVVVLDADTSHSTNTLDFATKYPERFFNMGCAEQNLLATAAGFANAGKIPFASCFSLFGTGRAWEQIRNFIVFEKYNVKMVFTHAGLSNAPDGSSHQSLEDIALMRVISGLIVGVPCDAEETHQMLGATLKIPEPVYIRLRRIEEEVLDKPYDFILGKAGIMKDGSDITLVGTGMTVPIILQAAKQLKNIGISARVLNIHTIQPIDETALIQAAQETAGIVTIENHSTIGGLGGAVTEVITSKNPCIVKRIGVSGSFGESALTVSELFNRYGLTTDHVVTEAKTILKK